MPLPLALFRLILCRRCRDCRTNQFTNPVLVQNYDQGDARLDYNLGAKDTLFGRFSKQNTLTLTPSTFGFRTVPGVSVPLALGAATSFSRAPLNSYNAVIGTTHLFSPTFLLDLRMGYSRFNLHNIDATAPTTGAGLGQQLGVPNSNQVPQVRGTPIFSIPGY